MDLRKLGRNEKNIDIGATTDSQQGGFGSIAGTPNAKCSLLRIREASDPGRVPGKI